MNKTETTRNTLQTNDNDAALMGEVVALLQRIDSTLERMESYTRTSIGMKPYYSAAEVSKMLNINKALIKEFTERKNDPMPFRNLPWKKRGKFIYHNELVQWVGRNAPKVSQTQAYEDGGRNGI